MEKLAEGPQAVLQGCAMCRLAVPTRKYKGGTPGAERSERLCKFCGASYVSNALFYPDQHIGKFYLYHAIMYVGHRIFRELRELRRELRQERSRNGERPGGK